MAYVGEYPPPGVFARPKEQRCSRKLRLSPLRLGEQIYRENLARLSGWPVTAILFFLLGLTPSFLVASGFAARVLISLDSIHQTDILLYYRIYSINRPGRLLNFLTLRVGAYSRWAFIRGWALIKFSPFSASEVVYFATKQ